MALGFVLGAVIEIGAKMDRPTCPKCGSKELRYVQRCLEYHIINRIYDGGVDLGGLDDSYEDDNYSPRIVCLDCDTEFNTKLEPKV